MPLEIEDQSQTIGEVQHEIKKLRIDLNNELKTKNEERHKVIENYGNGTSFQNIQTLEKVLKILPPDSSLIPKINSYINDPENNPLHKYEWS